MTTTGGIFNGVKNIKQKKGVSKLLSILGIIMSSIVLVLFVIAIVAAIAG